MSEAADTIRRLGDDIARKLEDLGKSLDRLDDRAKDLETDLEKPAERLLRAFQDFGDDVGRAWSRAQAGTPRRRWLPRF